MNVRWEMPYHAFHTWCVNSMSHPRGCTAQNCSLLASLSFQLVALSSLTSISLKTRFNQWHVRNPILKGHNTQRHIHNSLASDLLLPQNNLKSLKYSEVLCFLSLKIHYSHTQIIAPYFQRCYSSPSKSDLFDGRIPS